MIFLARVKYQLPKKTWDESDISVSSLGNAVMPQLHLFFPSYIYHPF